MKQFWDKIEKYAEIIFRDKKLFANEKWILERIADLDKSKCSDQLKKELKLELEGVLDQTRIYNAKMKPLVWRARIAFVLFMILNLIILSLYIIYS